MNISYQTKTMKHKKRIVAIIVSLAMCASLIPSVSGTTWNQAPQSGDRDYSPLTVGMFDQEYWNLLLAPGADQSKMNFSWHSDRSVDDIGIGFQERNNAATYTFVSGVTKENTLTTAGTAAQRSVRSYQINNVTLDGLKPATTYDYVLIQDGAPSEFFSFTTADPNNFSFYAMADIQIGADSGNRPHGESRNHEFHTQNWRAALSIARRIAPHGAFIMSAGDQVEAVGTQNATLAVYQGEYDLFTSPKQLSGLPIAPSVGNHDFHPMVLDHYNVPQNDANFNQFGTTNGVEFDYWFRHGNTFFLVLTVQGASSATWSGGANGATRFAKVREWATANEDATWKIAMFHYPPYSIYRADNDSGKSAVRNAFTPVLDEIGIDLVINGHCHNYNRTHHISGGTGSGLGTPILEQNWVDRKDGTVHEGEFGDQGVNQGAGGAGGTGWNDLGKKGFDAVLNPEGAVYFSLSTPSGSKFYHTNGTSGSGGGNPRVHSAKFNHQSELPHFSVIDVTENTVTFTTYQIEGKAGSSLGTGSGGSAPLPGGTGTGTTTPANVAQISAENGVSLVDTYTIIKCDCVLNGGRALCSCTEADILTYLGQEPAFAHIPSVEADGGNETDVKVSLIPQEQDIDDVRYDVEITWGDMEFYYDATEGVEEWAASDVDGVNNIVTVTNRAASGAIDAIIEYTDNGVTSLQKNDSTVKGSFYTTNANAQSDTDPAPIALITLSERVTSQTPESESVYFAFTGVPGNLYDRTMTSLVTVGTLTVSIMPAGYYVP